MQCNPVGVVRCPVTETSLGNWGNVESRIEIAPLYAGGLRGLEGFSHVVVAFWLDRAPAFDPATQLMRNPKGKADLPAVGVFAQRTRFRPNPIGITSVRLLGVEDAALRVRGLDALDGTPVLDIKPYMPMFDRMEDAAVPSWVENFSVGYF